MMILALIMMMTVKPRMPEKASGDVSATAPGDVTSPGMTTDAMMAPKKACKMKIAARTLRLSDARLLFARTTPASMK